MWPLLLIGGATYAAFIAYRKAQQNSPLATSAPSGVISDAQPGITTGLAPNAARSTPAPFTRNIPSASASGVPGGTVQAQLNAKTAWSPAPGNVDTSNPYHPANFVRSTVTPQGSRHPRSRLPDAPASVNVVIPVKAGGGGQAGGGCSCGGHKKKGCNKNGSTVPLAGSATEQLLNTSPALVAQWAETARTAGAFSYDNRQANQFMNDETEGGTPAAAPTYSTF